MNEANFNKAMRSAREQFLRDCVGICFVDPAGDRIRVDRVDSDGNVSLFDVIAMQPTTFIPRDRHQTLIEAITAGQPFQEARTGYLLESENGEPRIVVDWPIIVLHSGYTVRELKQQGIAHCLLNRRPPQEAWT